MADATALAQAIAAGDLTPRAAMEAALEAADRHAGLGAVARLEPSLGLDAEIQDGPFAGLPFLGKDLGSAARGMAPGAGCGAIRSRLSDPDTDSALFARFRTAGLVPFGLTTVPECGMALSSEPVGAAPARNPFDPTRTPGGSSGGAAAAVAAGIVAIAHATDAAGSIRVPAACCGLFGLKPSRGVIPQGPDYGNLLMGLASELVLTRSLRDLETTFCAVTGARPAAPPDQPHILFAIPDRCDPAQAEATRKAADAFAATGARITEIAPPDTLGAKCGAVARLIFGVSQAEFTEALGIDDAEISPISAAVAHQGRATKATELFAATRQIARLSDAGAALLNGADALLMPVLSGPPPRIGHFDPADTDPANRFALMESMAPNAALANVTGLPALAFPFGMQGNLPLGLQLLGPMGRDRTLIALAAAVADPVDFPHPIAGFLQ